MCVCVCEVLEILRKRFAVATGNSCKTKFLLPVDEEVQKQIKQRETAVMLTCTNFLANSHRNILLNFKLLK